MSRIGRKPIPIPGQVAVTVDDGRVTVRGPKGELERKVHRDMVVRVAEGSLWVERPSDEPRHRALHGLTRALLANMVEGVSNGFRKVLEIEGVGYRAEETAGGISLSLGYSHSIIVQAPPGIELSVAARGKQVAVSGADTERVGRVAADIQQLRPPEPFKGKGVRYAGQLIRMKAGKSGRSGQ
jgi:large subunit ribosomal protein L6